MPPELIDLCQVDIVIDDTFVIGQGPSGIRAIAEVKSIEIKGERLAGSLLGHASADWLTLVGTVATVDVRSTIRTPDGATIFIEYRGRSDFSQGPVGTPIYVAPLFETADPRYAWLNLIQAVGVGQLEANVIHYEWFEVR